MLKKTDVTNLYTMEELLPVVAKLAVKYTFNESSSVTYEQARQLMDAVIYCICHLESDEYTLAYRQALPAQESYQLGLDAVIAKIRSTQNKYNQLMEFFDHYGNRNYRDTVEKALPAFFLYYDPRYAPAETIITMDYPVLGMDMNLEGIDMIRQYIDAIWEEQYFLKQFSRDEILRLLRSFHPHYEKEYFNLREIVEIERRTCI